MITLGIDPGFARCGYAFIEAKNSAYKIVDSGLIETFSNQNYNQRLSFIYTQLDELIKKYNLTVKEGFYPTVYTLFDNVNSYNEKLYQFDVDEMLQLEKTTLKEDGKKIHTIKVDNITTINHKM